MSNRHERRKATAAYRKSAKLTTLDQHFENALRHVRAEFERTGKIDAVFECMTNGESFHVHANWPDRNARGATYAALRDSFRRRGVNRYVFASEGWVGKTPGLLPTDDPGRGECVQVIAVERNGPRRCAVAEITRIRDTVTLGPWQVSSEAGRGWLVELLEDGYSDRSPKPETPPLGRISNPDLQDLVDRHPEHRLSFEIHSQLFELIADQAQKHDNGDPAPMFMALEGVLRSMIKDMGSPKGIGEFARFLRDHPDHFEMFSTVPETIPSTRDVRRCKTTLQSFICEKRELGHTASTMFEAFMNTYMQLGSRTIGALNLADRIENWSPERQAKLLQVGLRSSFELDDEEGGVFLALTADRYPFGVMGRRNAIGDLFVSRILKFRQADFATAVEEIKQFGTELILGSEAKELLYKMEQVTGALPRNDRKEIWEVEEWGTDDWGEQALAESVFAEFMNVEHLPEVDNLSGNVAGYRVRRAPNGLVLLPSDGDEEIFIGVKVEKEKHIAYVLGWLRGSEGKLPHYYQKNRWVVPAEALHDMEELPGKERLRAMPPYREMSS